MTYRGEDIVKSYDERYQYGYYAWNAFYPRADEDLRYFLGDQWSEEERQALFEENRTALTINRIKPNINMITGYQRKHRLSSVVVPQEPNDNLIADQLSKLLLYVFQKGDFYESISDAFEGAVVTGWNLLSLWMDYRYDPLGEIAVSREPYNAFITDPYFSKRDLSDCSYLMRRKYISYEQAMGLLPEAKKDLKILYKQNAPKDDKFTWLPYQRLPSGQKMMAYDEYWEQGFDEKRVIYDVLTGEEYPYDGNDTLLLSSPDLQIVKKVEPYVLQHIIVNNQYIHTEKNPLGLNEYPFIPFLSVFMPESDQWALKIQSIVRTMKDAQKEGNKRRSQMIDLIESQLNSGWIAEDGSVINPRSLFQTGQGKVIWRKRGADPTALQRLDAAQIPPSFFQAKESFDQDVQFSANISEELLGQADSEQDSGLKVALRQGAALVGLQGVFDNLRYSQKILTTKCIKLMQNWPAAKLKRILNEEPSPQIIDQKGLKYDIAVKEGLLTQTQQEMFFKQLIALKELGEPVPPGLIAQAAPIQGKVEYQRAMEEFQKAQEQQAQQQAQVQQSLLQSEQILAQSQALSDLALAKERVLKSETDVAEKAAKIQDDRADTVLRRLEAVKRLEDLDDSRLDRLIGLIERMDAIEKSKEEQTKAEAEMKAAEAIKPQEVPSGQESRQLEGLQSTES